MKYILPLALVILMMACQEKKSSASANPETATRRAVAHLQPPPVYLDSTATEKQILDHLAKRRQDVEGFLRTATPEQADKTYEDYQKENDSAMVILMNRNTQLLEKYVNFFSYDEQTDSNRLTIPKEYQQEIKNMGNHGVEFWYVGEGYTELRMNPDFYYKLFTGRLTPDFQRYLDFRTKEDKVLYSADAGILVPWEDIGGRILVRENFLKDFPNSKLAPEIKNQLKYYRLDYLLGQDNTPVFSGVNEYADKIDEEIYREFLRFMKANPTSETTEMLTELLKNPTPDRWPARAEELLGRRYE